MTLIADKERKITSGGLGNRSQVPQEKSTLLMGSVHFYFIWKPFICSSFTNQCP